MENTLDIHVIELRLRVLRKRISHWRIMSEPQIVDICVSRFYLDEECMRKSAIINANDLICRHPTNRRTNMKKTEVCTCTC